MAVLQTVSRLRQTWARDPGCHPVGSDTRLCEPPVILQPREESRCSPGRENPGDWPLVGFLWPGSGLLQSCYKACREPVSQSAGPRPTLQRSEGTVCPWAVTLATLASLGTRSVLLSPPSSPESSTRLSMLLRVQ